MSEIQELAQHIQDFPALVRKARMDKGITNEELAELSGISYSAVCKMQSGERDPKLYDAVAVMKAVGISADQVFDIQPPASAPSAMQERIHELELDNAVSSGDVVRLKQVNGLCTQRLDAVIRQRDHYKRWSVFSSIFAAILSLFLIVYLFLTSAIPMPASSSKTDIQRLRGLLSSLCLFLSACAALSDTSCCAILQKRPHFENRTTVLPFPTLYPTSLLDSMHTFHKFLVNFC